MGYRQISRAAQTTAPGDEREEMDAMPRLDLEALYGEVKERLDALDFGAVWPLFRPLKFALYDEAECFLDGRYVEKTGAFCANTAIEYEGEQTAIWMVQGETDPVVLTSKIVHEMFHGFQRLSGWDCWPDELEALRRYRYQPDNLGLKLRENELLLKLLDGPDKAALTELLRHRKLRSERAPFESAYESAVEEIEGSACYVEWQALRQLDGEKASALTARMRSDLTRPEYLFPVRISCYDTGALMIHALREAGRYSFTPAERPAILPVLRDVKPSNGTFPGDGACFRAAGEAVGRYVEETEAVIRSALERNETVLEGPAELTGVNVYNARCLGEFITTTYFLACRKDGEDRMLPGNFVIRMQDEKTIRQVYRWEGEA